MKKIAIIGASYLQEPLIEKAKDMGIETHVFAWKAGDVGEKRADYFYDISIVEKEKILKRCKEIGIDGICSIASDLAMVTVNYVAHCMGLIGNSLECTEKSTNKHQMRKAFFDNEVSSPKSELVSDVDELKGKNFDYPVIVKPLDRSGSRGITKVYNANGLNNAIDEAKKVGFIKSALVEEFVPGDEYSVEAISWEGKHKVIAITKKYTTGEPNYIEKGHIQPAKIEDEKYQQIVSVVIHALTVLGITYGASHSEFKITPNDEIKIIEIGGRMGGDFIGSNLVPLSSGYDYIKAVIQISLGIEPDLNIHNKGNSAGVRFIFSEKDVEAYYDIQKHNPEMIVDCKVDDVLKKDIKDSSERCGYYIISSEIYEDVRKYMPDTEN